MQHLDRPTATPRPPSNPVVTKGHRPKAARLLMDAREKTSTPRLCFGPVHIQFGGEPFTFTLTTFTFTTRLQEKIPDIFEIYISRLLFWSHAWRPP